MRRRSLLRCEQLLPSSKHFTRRLRSARPPPTTDQIVERFAEGPIWIAELADTIVGTVATVPKGTELYIRSIAVRPGARGSGIGARLLNTVEAFGGKTIRDIRFRVG
jgi:GNAT superfamily N-acetyltransferase